MKALKINEIQNFERGQDPKNALNVGERRDGVTFDKFRIHMVNGLPKDHEWTYEDVVDDAIDKLQSIAYSMEMEYKGGDIDNEGYLDDMDMTERENWSFVQNKVNMLEGDLNHLNSLLSSIPVPKK